MKATSRLLRTFLLFASLSSFAQVPLVTLVGMPGNKVMDGKTTIINTTSGEIIKSAQLTGNDVHCVIEGYTFSIVAGSKTWSAHVKGDKLTPMIIKKIKTMKGPGVKVYIDGIVVVYDGKKASANPVILAYDE